jgi:hypothetical protein
MNVSISYEALAAELPAAELEVSRERNLPAPPTAAQRADISAGVDSFLESQEADGSADQSAPTSIWREAANWWDHEFKAADDKAKEFASRVLADAKKLGVSAEHLLTRLQQRILNALIQENVLLPFVIGQEHFTASSVSVTSTLSIAPSLTAADKDAVLELVTKLFSLSLAIDATYAPPGAS